MKRLTLVLAAMTLLTTSVITAQTPERPKNLQVLGHREGDPKDWSMQQVAPVMQAFSKALGVQCSYCHVVVEGGPGTDFASDAKPLKKTARLMLRLTSEINNTLRAELGPPRPGVVRVHCATCHRGATVPTLD